MWQKEIGSKILSILKLNNQILNYKHSWLIKLYTYIPVVTNWNSLIACTTVPSFISFLFCVNIG